MQMLSAVAGSRMSEEPSPSTVLVVEDEILVRTATAEYLRMVGYKVVEAGNAAEAMAVLDAGMEIDLVFSDIVMPGDVDGVGLVLLVRSRHGAIPVVLTSGDQSRAADAKIADFFVRKPYRASALARRIAGLIERSKA